MAELLWLNDPNLKSVNHQEPCVLKKLSGWPRPAVEGQVLMFCEDLRDAEAAEAMVMYHK